MDFISELKEESLATKKLISTITERVSKYPSGTLRTSSVKKKIVTYYHCSKDFADKYPNGKYIRNKDIALAAGLAQRDYDQKLLDWATAQYKTINDFLSNYDESKGISIYKSIPVSHQNLVIPLVKTDEQYAEEWQNASFVPLNYHNDQQLFPTDRGECVRSKSEKILADLFFKMNIPYKYECPLKIKGKTLYPDFTILNKRTRKVFYWEHFGLMDVQEYSDAAVKKINTYMESGIDLGEQLLVSFETSSSAISMKSVEANIKKHLL